MIWQQTGGLPGHYEGETELVFLLSADGMCF